MWCSHAGSCVRDLVVDRSGRHKSLVDLELGVVWLALNASNGRGDERDGGASTACSFYTSFVL